jgi:pimeloyl-ACP methyl ester carboxylesterase
MYIAGTRLDRLSGIRDVLEDFTLVPTRQAYNTQRYQHALAALKKSKGKVKYLVGHSLGGAAAAALTEQFPDLQARVYGAPLLRSSASLRVKSFRHQYDPISALDRGAVVNRAPGYNPHSYNGF